MPESFKIGDIFDDKYELLAVLGAGGLGTVFKALQIDCQRIVALKILHRQNEQDDDFLARFKREGQVLSQLQHPNVLMIYGIGFSNSGTAYLSMELVEGDNLRKVLNSASSLPPERALRIIRDIARALSYVHGHGIIHRDLKPENIVLSDKPEPDTVKIIDFGLARPLAPADESLTASGALIGSFDYMSPEQGQGQRATIYSDIYSLTALLFELLTALRPFNADTPYGVLYKHKTDPRPQLDKSLNPELNKIISRGMAIEAKDRFSSMDEFATALDSALDTTDMRSPLDKNLPKLAALIGATVLVLAASVAVYLIQQQDSAQGRLQEILSTPDKQAGQLFLREEKRLLSQGKEKVAEELYAKFRSSAKYAALPEHERIDLIESCISIFSKKNIDFSTQIALDGFKELFSALRTEMRSGSSHPSQALHAQAQELAGFLLNHEHSDKIWAKIGNLFFERMSVPNSIEDPRSIDYGFYKSKNETSNELISLLKRPIGNVWALRAESGLHQSGHMTVEKATKLVYWLLYAADDAHLENNPERLKKYTKLADEIAGRYDIRETRLLVLTAWCYVHQNQFDKVRTTVLKARKYGTANARFERDLKIFEEKLAENEKKQ